MEARPLTENRVLTGTIRDFTEGDIVKGKFLFLG